jgi:hypothetical protein
MPQFQYQRLLHMQPRPGRRYATVYVKQTAGQRAAFVQWFTQRVAEILELTEQDPEWAQWWQQPDRRFPTADRSHWRSPAEIVEDLLLQISQGHDLARAQIDRWNRLAAHTPWYADFRGPQGQPLHQAPVAPNELIDANPEQCDAKQ